MPPIFFQKTDPISFDYNRYHALVGQRMQDVDYTNTDDLRAMLTDGRLAAWVVTTTQDTQAEWIGWCGLRLNHNKYHNPANHVWGIVTSDETANTGMLGLGIRMMRFLIEQSGTIPLTASIRPDNQSSLAIAKRLKFQEIAPTSDTWREFIRHP